MLEFNPREFSALSVLARGRAGKARLKDYSTITKTLSGDALLVARLMYGEPLPANKRSREADVRAALDHLTAWVNQLPRRADRDFA